MSTHSTSAIDDDTPLRRTGTILATPLEDTLLMLNVERGLYHEVNEVGARIWTLLEQPISISGLVAVLVGEYRVSEEECASAARAFVAELQQRGLISA